eukprot:4887_1
MFMIELIFILQIHCYQSIQLFSCGDSVTFSGEEFVYTTSNPLPVSYQNQYYIHFAFIYNGTFGEIRFDECNNISTSYKGIQIYNEQWEIIVPENHQYNAYCNVNYNGCCATVTSRLQENTLYYVVMGANTKNDERIIKIDMSCHCGYKCVKPNTCGDSLSRYGHQFIFDNSGNELTSHIDIYFNANITFTYKHLVNETKFDFIQLNTCNNMTTLGHRVRIWDHNGNEVGSMPGVYHYSNCVSMNLETTLIEENKFYRIVIEATDDPFNKAVKLNMNCFCVNCNYIIHPNSIAYSDVDIFDTMQLFI